MRKIAKDLVEGKIFTDRMVPHPSLLASVFMCIVFADQEFLDELKTNAGLIYEYYDSAGKMSINRYPIFINMRYLNKAETEIVFSHAKKYRRSRDHFLGEEKFEIEVEDATEKS